MLPELIEKWLIHVMLFSCLVLFCSLPVTDFTNRSCIRVGKEVKCCCITNLLLWVFHQHSKRAYTSNLILLLKQSSLKRFALLLKTKSRSARSESLFRKKFLQLSKFWKDWLISGSITWFILRK